MILQPKDNKQLILVMSIAGLIFWLINKQMNKPTTLRDSWLANQGY